MSWIFMRRRRRIVTEEDFADVIRRKRAKLWGISSKIVSAKRAMRIAELIKEIHPGALVVMGGVHPTFQAAEILQASPAVDAVARGEADISSMGLWRWAIGQEDLSNVQGVSYRAADGTICETEKNLEQIDLDTLPYPAYHLVARETDPLVPRILTARGCTLRCVFCASAALFGYKFNSREAERVVDQIEHMRDEFGCEFVCLGDLTFMAHRPTGMAICRLMIERNVGVNWSTQTTVGRIDEEAADLMAPGLVACKSASVWKRERSFSSSTTTRISSSRPLKSSSKSSSRRGCRYRRTGCMASRVKHSRAACGPSS
jgi:anaerobic magnesium-protoporphyrin IX monomethyl ester cyclase